MIRLLEIFVALVIVAILAVVFAIALPNHRHIDKAKVYSAPVRQIYDVLDGYRTYPSWPAPLRAYDAQVRFDFAGPEMGSGAKLTWTASADSKLGNGGFTIIPDPVQDKQVRWAIDNNWKGTGKTLTWDLEPAENGRTVKVTLGYDVDYGWDLLARYSGLYVGGEPSTWVQLHLDNLEKYFATVPNVDYKDTTIDLKDIAARPLLCVSTKAKRNLDDVADATGKALEQIQADIKRGEPASAEAAPAETDTGKGKKKTAAAPKVQVDTTGPRMTVTTNFGDENYEFDVCLPVSRNDIKLTDPVKAVDAYTGKGLQTSFTGSPAQLPGVRRMLQAYALTHGYGYDDSGTGPGRAYDELTTTDSNAADDQQSFTVTLPVTVQQ